MAVLLGLASAARAEPVPFELPASLQPAVGFWARVYSEWDSSHHAIHDTAHVEVVYRVVDLTALEAGPKDSTVVRQQKAAARMNALLDARRDVEDALEALDARRPMSIKGLKGAQREAYEAWEHRHADPERFASARGRVRSQRGNADRYAEGWRSAGRFVGAIQGELAAAGLPSTLVALSMTESLLNLHARSVSGAVGPWQFLKGTGREYLCINDLVDERKDPVLATRAAARYLTQSKKRLGSWGVAITGYNYGMNGMARAVGQLGTDDIEVVLREYRTNAFGFAARNYYAEFLASLHVVTHADHYFPSVKPVAPWTYDVVSMRAPTRVTDVVKAGVDRQSLAELNPSLTAEALAGGVAMPVGFTLRVPAGKGQRVLDELALLPRATPAAGGRTYTVRAGDTLVGLSRRNNLTLGELAAVNALNPHDALLVGAVLTLPAPSVHFTPLPEAQGARPGTLLASRSMAASSPLPRFASVYARRSALDATAVAAVDTTTLTPAARPRDTTLTASLPPPPPPPPLSAVELTSAWTQLVPMVSRKVAGGRRVAGGPLRMTGEDDDETAAFHDVDVVVGREDLPAVDMVVGAGWMDGTPLPPVELKPVSPVGEPQS
jgi:membrane-bound lytic murein transglycosylase D